MCAYYICLFVGYRKKIERKNTIFILKNTIYLGLLAWKYLRKINLIVLLVWVLILWLLGAWFLIFVNVRFCVVHGCVYPCMWICASVWYTDMCIHVCDCVLLCGTWMCVSMYVNVCFCVLHACVYPCVWMCASVWYTYVCIHVIVCFCVVHGCVYPCVWMCASVWYMCIHVIVCFYVVHRCV